jgi:tetratricopeptide (TPR) repeat protein
MFYKGGALGYRGLVRSLRESWLKAAEDGKEALNLLQKAYDINKDNKDVIFGIGMYNYFAEYVPDAYPVVKPLMLIFPKGDKIKGLSQIKESSNDSRFTKTEAKYVLAYLNLVYEKNYTEAEIYSSILNKEYPENPIFQKYLYNSYIGQGKWDLAIEGWKNILEKIDSNLAGYNNLNLRREANYYTAVCLSKLNRLGEAGDYLKNAEDITRILDKENETAFTSFIYLLSGMYNDLKGNKATAELYYNKVLSMKNFQNSHGEAEKFKKDGFKQF